MHQDVRLKVCGMRAPGNIAQVAALRPDYMGFIFYEKSPRFVGEDFALPKDYPSGIEKVGVFVNADTDDMLEKMERHGLAYLQLHGNEPVQQVADLARKGARIIKAFGVDEGFDFAKTEAYRDFVSYFLFDTKGQGFGGNGTPFDWSLLGRYQGSTPFFLAGGISPANVLSLDRVHPGLLHAIDVNSGVETEPGVKDAARVREIVNYIINRNS